MTKAHGISAARRHKISLIKEALGHSDATLHRLYVRLDAFELAAKQQPSATVDPAWIRTLDKIHAELMGAVGRVGNLQTGLKAEDDLRKALINRAQGFTAWSYALSSHDLAEIAAARVRLRRHFDMASFFGERGTGRSTGGSEPWSTGSTR